MLPHSCLLFSVPLSNDSLRQQHVRVSGAALAASTVLASCCGGWVALKQRVSRHTSTHVRAHTHTQHRPPSGDGVDWAPGQSGGGLGGGGGWVGRSWAPGRYGGGGWVGGGTYLCCSSPKPAAPAACFVAAAVGFVGFGAAAAAALMACFGATVAAADADANARCAVAAD